MMAELKACPEIIYLQACDKCYAESGNGEDGITWCVDFIGHYCENGIEDGEDTKYIRKDRYDALQSELDYMTAYADKLADGYPEGMLPTDIQTIKDANWKLAQEIFDLKQAVKDAVETIEIEIQRQDAILHPQLTDASRTVGLYFALKALRSHGLIKE